MEKKINVTFLWSTVPIQSNLRWGYWTVTFWIYYCGSIKYSNRHTEKGSGVHTIKEGKRLSAKHPSCLIVCFPVSLCMSQGSLSLWCVHCVKQHQHLLSSHCITASGNLFGGKKHLFAVRLRTSMGWKDMNRGSTEEGEAGKWLMDDGGEKLNRGSENEENR